MDTAVFTLFLLSGNWKIQACDVLGPAVVRVRSFVRKTYLVLQKCKTLSNNKNRWSHQNEVRDPESGVTAHETAAWMLRLLCNTIRKKGVKSGQPGPVSVDPFQSLFKSVFFFSDESIS